MLVAREDVAAFAAAHGPMGKIHASGSHSVDGVELLPAQAVNTRLKTRISVPPTTQLYLVTLRGSFAVAGPPGSGTVTSNEAYSVFDAETGNLLMVGLGPE